jgi:signal transduction histidine kinase
VLVNLIVNALRHTPAGGTITVDARTTEPGLVSFSVVDDGEGMAEDLADAAFDRFAKGPSSGGSGLGLAIARELVEAHGGRISLDSRLGTGTTVTFTVPLAE